MRLLAGAAGRAQMQRGTELLAAAAARCSGEAEAQLAFMAGAGVFRPQNWQEALDRLQRSAELGWKQAQAQLAALAADRELAACAAAPEPVDAFLWGQLRGNVDVAAWTQVPPRQSLCDAPKIRVIPHFIPQAICNWMIMRARGKLQRAQVYGDDGGARIDDARSNSAIDFNIVDSDLILLLLRARISAAVGVHPAGMELTKVLHYAVGQAYAPHFDFLDPTAPGFEREIALRGQRIGTVLIYLNDDYTGGETDFPQLGLRYKGRKGDALLFANVGDDQQPDRRTLHAGLAPTCGEKWLLSQWIRNRSPADE